MLLTGDNAAVAAQVAAEVGIAADDVIAGVLPSEKADVIKKLQADGRRVAMVGDGVNDSVALATADIGMAMGTGTDAAIEAGDITLVRGDLRTVPTALRLSSRTLRIIKQNLFWAFGYNTAVVILAALGLWNPDDRRRRKWRCPGAGGTRTACGLGVIPLTTAPGRHSFCPATSDSSSGRRP